MKPSDLSCTDLFCGAGGSSEGASAAGVRLVMAANHWPIAIETHSHRFPNADHLCADIFSADPRRFRSTNILIASPECTHHSLARTKKAQMTLFDPHGADEAERSRATMMDVPRFAEVHGYEVVIVENVIEVARWPGFLPWLQYMHNLGYRHRIVCLNSLVAHPTPQSRDRLYVVFWKEGNPEPNLDFRPASWCPHCETTVEGIQSWRRADRQIGKYRQQYDYRCDACRGIVYPWAYPAAAAIDWSLPTQRIGDRAKPLAAATRRRVEIGLQRFGSAIVQAGGHTWEAPGSNYARTWPLGDPIPTQTTWPSHALVQPPFLAVLRTHQDARSLDEVLPTPVAGNVGCALVQPPASAWLVSTTRQNEPNYRPRSVGEPMPTQTSQLEWALATPFIAELRGGRSDVRSIDEPLATLCAAGQHHAVVIPSPVPAFIVKNYGGQDKANAMAHAISNPLGTVTAVDHHSLVELPFLSHYYGNGGNTPVTEPVPTQTTHDHHALITPAIEVDDCGFRMLEPHEIKRAMAFPDDYRIVGNKRQQVRQCGQAVTPPVMRMLVERCVETLA